MSYSRSDFAGASHRETINQRHMESFAKTCFEWASSTDDASDRQTIMTAARGWLNIAHELDRQVPDGRELVDDLRTKLD